MIKVFQKVITSVIISKLFNLNAYNEQLVMRHFLIEKRRLAQ